MRFLPISLESIQQFVINHKTIFQALRFGLIVAYLYNIVTNSFHLFQIWKSLSRLKRFIHAYDQHHVQKRKRKLLLSYYPIISKYLGAHSDKLEYSDNDYNLYRKAISMYNAMLSKRDIQKHQLIGVLSPIYELKTIFTFPSKLLMCFDCKLSEIHIPLANIVGTIFEIFATKAIDIHYSDLEPYLKSVLNYIQDIWNRIF